MEDRSEEKEIKFQRAQEARQLLNSPLLQQYFEVHLSVSTNAFISLPLGATLDNYQTVHHDMLSAFKIRGFLEGVILEYQAMEALDEKPDAEGV